jgi:hypothetical protein
MTVDPQMLEAPRLNFTDNRSTIVRRPSACVMLIEADFQERENLKQKVHLTQCSSHYLRPDWNVGGRKC